MAISLLFKIGTTDLTGHVVQNTWKINNLPVYKTYKDANEQTHKRFLRNKISGTFKLVFADVADFASFQDLVEETDQRQILLFLALSMTTCQERFQQSTLFWIINHRSCRQMGSLNTLSPLM